MNDKTGNDVVDAKAGLQTDTQVSDDASQAADVEKTKKVKKPRKPRKPKAAKHTEEPDNSMGVLVLKPILEGAILAAGEPLTLDRMLALFVDDYNAPNKVRLKEALAALQSDCVSRGYELVEVASGWRFQVRNEYATWVNRLWDEKPQKYSRALLETLALIAYRQPLTRGDIEEVRGVTVSSQTIKTLSERDWVKVIGHRDVPGRPALYATTRHFLDYFNLKSLEELPSLGELKDIDGLNQSLDFELAATTLNESESNDAPEEQNIPEGQDTPADDESMNDARDHMNLTLEQEPPSDSLVPVHMANQENNDVLRSSHNDEPQEVEQHIDNIRDAGVDDDASATDGEDSLNVKKLNESSAKGRTNNE